MEFNKEEVKRSYQSAVDRLTNTLSKKGITLTLTDGENENVVLSNKKTTVKISHKCFFRYSGVAYLQKDKGQNEVEFVEVTNDMFLNEYLKYFIDLHFN